MAEKTKEQKCEYPEQSASVDPQTGSLLFQRLPQEIRNLIWTQLFCSTRFTFGQRPAKGYHKAWFRPAGNGLALLRTCRRARLEIGDSWLRYVTFCFEDIETMLDRLSARPIDTLSKLRHMRIRGDLFKLSHSDYDVHHRLVSALKLLPGLRLDQLTVLGGGAPHVCYDALTGLIKHGNGWNTLRYICHTSEMLGFPLEQSISHPRDRWKAQPQYWRKPQPKHWQTIMEARDGVASNPSVVVYRAKEPAKYGSILDPSRRVKFEQKPRHGQNLREDTFPADPELMTGDEPKKELLVIVKRGSGVDYEEKEDSPLTEDDIRRDFPGKTWGQIRAEATKNRFRYRNEDGAWPFGPVGDEEEYPPEVDSYKDVDEYGWTLFHSHPALRHFAL
ncbi:595b4278-7ac7-4ce7-ba6c-15d2eeaa20f0 [Thermothielavioides terrestris]|jgi:hypothetical protein|uniref:595b4278-7ac7-4ce7-ba6c-15d2eeaa20f0 n=1 Tax=Thermothielavioides terrestris TaxID=2587410 RepID=A0A446B730_9PEZI|nr:595b4278-7ac7-4ce7-ba6c-15d2eeaa20f0 [Thermothielavioides terrestris]